MIPSIPRLMRLTGKVPPSYQAVEIVLSILRDSPNGASTKEIYHRAAPKSIPRNAIEAAPDHPLKSMRYLKKTVLATLQEKGVVEKFHVPKEQTESEEPEPPAKGKKKKKQGANVQRLSFFWRIHEWKRSVAQAKAYEGSRSSSESTPTRATS